MLQTTWAENDLVLRSGFWRYETTNSLQRIVCFGYSQKLVVDVAGFLGKHFATLIRIDVEDLELLVAMIRNFLGEQSLIAVVVLEGNKVLFGVNGGVVYFSRGGKSGYLTNDSDAKFFSGNLEYSDKMIVGCGKDVLANMSSWALGKRWIQGEALGLVIESDNEKEPEPEIHLDEIRPPHSSKIDDHDDLIQKQKKTNKFFTKVLQGMQRLSLILPQRKEPLVYIKSQERKKWGLVALVVLLALLISVGLGWQKKKSIEKKESFEAHYQPALEILIEAEKRSTQEPLIAREKLIEARAIVTEALSSYDEKSTEKEKLSSLMSQIEVLYSKVSGEVLIENPKLFYDLSLVKDGMVGTKMAVGDGRAVVLDAALGTLVGIELSTKQAKVIAGGELLQGASLVAASTGKAVIFARAGLVGVFFGERQSEVLVQLDDIWQNIGAMGMFGGNVYLVDRTTGELWHYPGFDGGLGARKRWFGPGVLPDLTQIQSLAVDGDIWMGSKDGVITHYRRGAPLNVRLSGLVDPLGEIRSIAVEYEGEELFVLDSTNSRVVEFTKTGEYKKQFIWEGINKATDMVVAEIEGKRVILLLAGTQIFEVPVEK